jgi:nitroreductase
VSPDSVGLLEGICTTRAIRRYLSDPVPDHVLRDVLFAASRAPSGSNRQPFRFLVLTDGPKAAAAKTLIAAGARRAWDTKRSTDRYDQGSGADSTSPKASMARTMEAYVDQLDRVPVLILACLIRRRGPNPVEGASVYPACQNLLLAARALGYGGVMTSWNLLVDTELRALLTIPDEVFVAAAITLGPRVITVPSGAGRWTSSSSSMNGVHRLPSPSTRPVPGTPAPARHHRPDRPPRLTVRGSSTSVPPEHARTGD